MDYDLELEDTIFEGIQRWLSGDTALRSGINDWIDEIARRVPWDSWPTSDDIENIQFVSDFIWDGMDAATWITRGLGTKTFLSQMWEAAIQRLFCERE